MSGQVRHSVSVWQCVSAVTAERFEAQSQIWVQGLTLLTSWTSLKNVIFRVTVYVVFFVCSCSGFLIDKFTKLKKKKTCKE